MLAEQAKRVQDKIANKAEQMEAMEKELISVRRELAEARKVMAEGRGLEVEKQRQMEEELEKEREKRVEQVGAQALKRIVQQDLAKGWGAWHAMYSEHLRQKRMLAGAASRLTKPALVACMSHWR